MWMWIVKRTDSDGTVFIDVFSDARNAREYVVGSMNTDSVREINIMMRSPR